VPLCYYSGVDSKEVPVANREQRSNKEKKKPKKDKDAIKPVTTSTSPFGEQRNQKPQPGKK
jgi:hypothetical protein